MGDKTEVLIREIAEKLGTTVDHLWNVLLRQASITGAIYLLNMVAFAFVAVWMFRVIQTKTTKPKPTEADRYPSAEWEDEYACFAWILWVLIAVFGTFISLVFLNETISALVNPEYWALKQVLPAAAYR